MQVLLQILRRGALLILALAHVTLLWRAVCAGTKEQIDSPSYLAASPHRPPLYPLFLDLVDLLFPGDLHRSLHLVQVALGAFAIGLLARALHRRFSLDLLVTVALALFLAQPYFRWHWLGNFIMSEGLAYPLFLIGMYFLLEALAAASLRQLAYFFVVAVALFLTRKQFLFLFPIGFFVAAYLAFGSKRWRDFLRPAAMTCAALAAALLLAAGASWTKERQLPLMGIQLIPSPLYMLEGEIPPSLSPAERTFVAAAWDALHAAGMTRLAFEESKVLHGDEARHYASSFSTSVQRVFLPLASEELLGRSYDREDWRDLEGAFSENEARRIDEFLIGIWKDLFLASPDKVIAMYVDNVITHIGGPMMFLFFCIVAASSLFYTLKTGSWVTAFVTSSVLLHFGNFLFTAIFEPIYERYSFYTGNLALVALFCTILHYQRRVSFDEAPVPGWRKAAA